MTPGRFYIEKVLSQESLYIRSLPEDVGDVVVRQTLMGWRLYTGKQSIDCTSEIEARYLKVWLKARVKSVKVPSDESYLEVIVPELENLKRKIDEVIEPYLSSIADVNIRDTIFHQLWLGIAKEVVND